MQLFVCHCSGRVTPPTTEISELERATYGSVQESQQDDAYRTFSRYDPILALLSVENVKLWRMD